MRELYNSGEFTEADRDKVDSEAGGNGLPPLEPRSDRCYLSPPLSFLSLLILTPLPAAQIVYRLSHDRVAFTWILCQTVVLYTQTMKVY